MIIVAGQLRVAADDREAFLARSRKATRLARAAPGCIDFAVSADLLDPERVNVYEQWTDRSALHAFRGEGPDEQTNAQILSAEVREFEAHPSQSGAGSLASRGNPRDPGTSSAGV